MLNNNKTFQSLTVGIVRDNNDPEQMGRLKVYIPTLDSPNYTTDDLPWAVYVTPFGGSVHNMKVGREEKEIRNVTTYGMWNVPKNGAKVICACLDGDPQIRIWIGCIYSTELNRSLPFALNDPGTKELKTELVNSGKNAENEWKGSIESTPIDPQLKNLETAGLGPQTDNFKTRGWERSVAYPINRIDQKPDTDGYAKKPGGGDEKDSQIYSWTTPGRHFMVMSDVSDNCRIRFRTTEGHQIIFDDTNERIYVSTAKGRNWVELDEDGRIFIYAKDEINIRSEDTINLKSEKDINIRAKKKINIHSQTDQVNIQAHKDLRGKSSTGKVTFNAKSAFNAKVLQGPMKLNSNGDIHISSNSSKVSIFSANEFNIRAGRTIKLSASTSVDTRTSRIKTSASKIYLGGKVITPSKVKLGPCPPAQTAARAQQGENVPDISFKMVEPEKESWKRPRSKEQRNKKWKA